MLFWVFYNTLFLLFPAYAEPVYSVSTSASFGVLYGQAEEIVYKNDDSYDYLSQLLWDMKSLLFWNVSMNFERRNPLDGFGFFTETALKYGVNADSGVMQDRDWQGTHGQLTNYSVHWNYTQNALLLNLDAGVSFPVFKVLFLKIYGTFLFVDFAFESRDGYTQYVSSYADTWNDSLPKEYYIGPAINYKQLWFIGGLGVSLTLPLDLCKIHLAFNASPIVFCAAHDSHLSYSGEFYDFIQNGVLLEPKAELSFPISRFIIAFFFSHKYTAGTYGLTYKQINGRYIETGAAGAGFSIIETGLTVKVMW
jgi:outer membrane protease